MTTNYINWFASVDIMFVQSTRKHQSSLPSWCPDYFHLEMDSSDRNIIPYVCGKDLDLAWQKRRAFGASARMTQEVPDSFHVQGRKLTLKGVRVGYISLLGGVAGEDAQLHRSNDVVFTTATRNSPELVARALRRLLLISHDRTFGHLDAQRFITLLYALPEEYFRQHKFSAVRVWLQDHRPFLEGFGLELEVADEASQHKLPMRLRRNGFLDQNHSLECWRDYLVLGESVSRRGLTAVPILRSIDSVLEERLRLMCIGNEAFLGWAHRNAQPGDSVWNLEGCSMPAILRKSRELSETHGEDIYKLVGHAYIDPVMASGRLLAGEDKGRLVHLY
jgi:hypothetical protein